MSVLTPWGYSITGDATALPSILSAEEFNAMTANKYEGDARVPSMLAAAEMAVRNWCGWHVADSEPCEMVNVIQSLHITRTGADVLIQLPARYVSRVSHVYFNAQRDNNDQWTGDEYEQFCTTGGLLRVYNVGAQPRVSGICIQYTAGLPDGLAGDIKELIAHRVTHALASPYGVQSEAAGGVSITYNATWINNSRATALPDDNKAVLAPYRLEEVL